MIGIYITSNILLAQIYWVSGTWPQWGGRPPHHSAQLTKGAMATPVIKWALPLDTTEWQFSAVYDVNKDGIMDIVFTDWSDRIYCIRGLDGYIQWQHQMDPPSDPLQDCQYSCPAVGDLDGDGVNEVVVGGASGMVYCVSGNNGARKWSYPTGDNIESPPTIANIRGDSKMEVLIGSNDKKLYCLNSSGGLEWSFTTGGVVRSCPAVADIDNDGSKEVVFTSADYYIYCLDANGNEKWRTSVWASISSPVLVDLDGDSQWEVIVGSSANAGKVYCLNSNGTWRWEYGTGATIQASASVADVDGNGKIDIIIGSNKKKVFCLEETSPGNVVVKWIYPGPGPGDTLKTYVHNPGALADVEGDGKLEYLVSQLSNDTLYCINAESGTLLWKIKLAFDIHTPVAADVDNDGCVEIIVGTYGKDAQNNRLFVLDDPNNSHSCGPLYEEVEEGTGIDPFDFRWTGRFLSLSLPKTTEVSLQIYNSSGILVQNLFDGSLAQGEHLFAPSLEAKGVYLAVLRYHGGFKTLKFLK